MKPEIKQRIEIGENLRNILLACIGAFGLLIIASAWVGGCAVDGHYKAKAAEALQERGRMFDNGAPGGWGIRPQESEPQQ